MESINTTTTTIILAGGTGKLGQRIAYYLNQCGAEVRALVRQGSNSTAEIASLR